MAVPDLVVPVREVAVNPQLRYALRSWAAHLPHRRVWTVGYRHRWLTGEAGHIPTRQDGTGYVNTTTAMRAACEHPEVSDPFVWANDDTFVMRPQPDGMPVLHRGPMRELVAARFGRTGPYVEQLAGTYAWLMSRGYDEPLSYDVHAPLPVSKAGMLRALDEGRGHDAHKRTVYGVLNGIGGERVQDVKIAYRAPRGYADRPFLSTMPDAFTNGHVGTFIRAAFPWPCRYETAGRY